MFSYFKFPPWNLIWRRATGLSPPVKYFTDPSKAVLLLCIFLWFFFCLVFVMPLCASCLYVLYGHLLVTWLSFVVSNCEFVTYPLVYWVRCDT